MPGTGVEVTIIAASLQIIGMLYIIYSLMSSINVLSYPNAQVYVVFLE